MEDGSAMVQISDEKRELLIAAKQRGETEGDIALWLGVGKRSVSTLRRRFRTKGDVLPTKDKGRPPKLADGDVERIRLEVGRTPDAALGELVEGLSLPIGKSHLARLLAAMGLSPKKRRSTRRTSSARTSSAKGRRGGSP
jgi:transposase